MTRIALNYLQNQLLAKEDLTNIPHPHKENSTLNFHFDQQNNQQDSQQGNRENSVEELHNRGGNMNNDFRENGKRDNREISHGRTYPNYSSPREKNNRFSRDIDERSRSRSNEKKGRFTGKKVGQRTQFKGNKRDERTHKKIERHQGDYSNFLDLY